MKGRGNNEIRVRGKAKRGEFAKAVVPRLAWDAVNQMGRGKPNHFKEHQSFNPGLEGLSHRREAEGSKFEDPRNSGGCVGYREGKNMKGEKFVQVEGEREPEKRKMYCLELLKKKRDHKARRLNPFWGSDHSNIRKEETVQKRMVKGEAAERNKHRSSAKGDKEAGKKKKGTEATGTSELKRQTPFSGKTSKRGKTRQGKKKRGQYSKGDGELKTALQDTSSISREKGQCRDHK